MASAMGEDHAHCGTVRFSKGTLGTTIELFEENAR